jgi:hypothetical protein
MTSCAWRPCTHRANQKSLPHAGKQGFDECLQDHRFRAGTCGNRPADGLRIDTNGAGVMNGPWEPTLPPRSTCAPVPGWLSSGSLDSHWTLVAAETVSRIFGSTQTKWLPDVCCEHFAGETKSPDCVLGPCFPAIGPVDVLDGLLLHDAIGLDPPGEILHELGGVDLEAPLASPAHPIRRKLSRWSLRTRSTRCRCCRKPPWS